MRYKKLLVASLLGAVLGGLALLRFTPLAEVEWPTWERWCSEMKGTSRAEKEQLAAAQERQGRLQNVTRRVNGVIDDARTRMLSDVKVAREKAESIIAGQRAAIPKLTESANEKLQGYLNAMGLARRMAEDKVRGTHKTQEYLQEAFQPVVHAQAMTEARVLQILKECTALLNVESARVQAETAQILDSSGFKAADLGLEKSLKRLAEAQASVLKASMGAAVATVEVAVEALLIKTTYESISKLLAKAVAKEVTSLAIGAEGAAIPVVDVVTTVIAVGGTVWTAFDVNHAVGELKKVEPVIRSGLEDSVAQLEQKTREAFAGLETTTTALFSQS